MNLKKLEIQEKEGEVQVMMTKVEESKAEAD